MAVANGEFELVKRLIAAGADLTYEHSDTQEQIDYSLLYLALIYKHNEIEEFLTTKWLEHYLSCSKILAQESDVMRKIAAKQLNKKLTSIIDNTDEKLKDKYDEMYQAFTGFQRLDKFLTQLNACPLINFSDLMDKAYYQAEKILGDNLPEYTVQEKSDLPMIGLLGLMMRQRNPILLY